MIRRITTEYAEQVALFDWARRLENRIPELALLNASPGGEARPKRINPRTGRWYSPAGQRLQRAGYRRGFPDIFLPVARPGYHGLFIELKSGANRLTDEQVWWLARLAEQGYQVAVCYSFEAARDELYSYLGLRRGDYETD